MITIEEARKIIRKTFKPLEPAITAIDEALGSVLAEDIVSRDAIPPFDNSAMDGYAARAEDTTGASAENPVLLEVVEDVRAGGVANKAVMAGQAIRIMTGAQMPGGADTVIKVEDTLAMDGSSRSGFERGGTDLVPVAVAKPARKGDNIRRAGEDVASGETVLKVGDTLGPAEIGLLASLGYPAVSVYRRPRVAIITTGDELLEVNQPLVPGKIRNSNAYSLAAQVKLAGAEPVRMGIAEDTKEGLRALFEKALAECDVVLTTGGVSVGKYDVVKDVLDESGARQAFWKVAQKPGNPLGLWTTGDKYVFGLPGNPVATMVCFEEYVRPALRIMMGCPFLYRPSVRATLVSDVKKRAGRVHFIRVSVEEKDGAYFVDSTGPQGSGILKSMVLADGLAVIPAEAEKAEAGSQVVTHLIKMPEDH